MSWSRGAAVAWAMARIKPRSSSPGQLSPAQAHRLALALESIEDAWQEEDENNPDVLDDMTFDAIHAALMELSGFPVVHVARAQVEGHRKFWADVAKKNGWYAEPFFVQLWINPDDGNVSDSVATKGQTRDIFVNNITDSEFKENGCQVVG